MFTLHHLQSKHCSGRNKPLYVCFIDFVKAFDMVRRDLLWHRCETLGLGGNLMRALRAMYADVRFRVKLAGKLGAFFQSLSGVKQGDPLSPTLFGVFVEVLPEFLNAMHLHRIDLFDAGCPTLDDTFLIFHMLFADDLTLISKDAAHMQAMLNTLADYCGTVDMHVNLEKSEVLVMGKACDIRRLPPPTFTLRATPLRRVTTARYLGVTFQETGGFSCMVEKLTASANRCRFVLQRALPGLALTPHLQVQMFMSLCRPIMAYGCQVWGADYLKLPTHSPTSGARHSFHPCSPFEKVQTQFLRHITGGSRSTPVWAMLDDCSVDSMQHHFAGCIMRFWNAMRSDDDRMLSHAARGDISLMLSGNRKCWTFKVCTFLARLTDLSPDTSPPFIPTELKACFAAANAIPFPANAADLLWGHMIMNKDALAVLRMFWRSRVLLAGTDPLTSPFPAFSTYLALCGPKPEQGPKRRAHMTCIMPCVQFRCLSRFRLGAWRCLAGHHPAHLHQPARQLCHPGDLCCTA